MYHYDFRFPVTVHRPIARVCTKLNATDYTFLFLE